VDDVVSALQCWVEPVNSVLVADRSGAMRQLVAGLVPVRHKECRRLPVAGWEPRYAWQGYAALACVEVAGVAVTANDRRPDVAALGDDFAPPHRAHRIRTLVEAGAPPESVHMDVKLGSTVLLRLLASVDP